MAPSLVQARQITGTFSLSFVAATTAGNCVVACMLAYATSSGTISVTGATLGGINDSFGGLVSVQSPFAAGITTFAAIWADPGCSGGETAVAASVTGGTAATLGGLVIMEWAGLATGGVLDQSSTNSGSTGTSWSSGSTPATEFPAEVVIGAAFVSANITGPSSPWTNYIVGPGSGNKIAAAGQMVTSSTGAQSYAGTQSVSGPWASAVVALEPPTPIPGLITPGPQPVRRAAFW